MLKRALYFSTMLLLLCAAASAQSPDAVTLDIPVDGAVRVTLAPDEVGQLHYRLELRDGSVDTLSPAQFSQRLYQNRQNQPWHQILFNITSAWGLAWVALGLLGQVLFSGRMIVQWLFSERAKQSVVPPIFWWMSLVGASMLLVYFVWRKDIVGVLGQGVGWLIYVRNLRLIYRSPNTAPLHTPAS